MHPSVVIYAKDADRIARFYSATLGLTATESDAAVSFRCIAGGGYTIVVVTAAAAVSAMLDIATPPVRRTGTPLKVVFPVASIAAARNVAVLHGGRVEPVETQWKFEGSWRCDGVDPEGNVLQLAEPAAIR